MDSAHLILALSLPFCLSVHVCLSMSVRFVDQQRQEQSGRRSLARSCDVTKMPPDRFDHDDDDFFLKTCPNTFVLSERAR